MIEWGLCFLCVVGSRCFVAIFNVLSVEIHQWLTSCPNVLLLKSYHTLLTPQQGSPWHLLLVPSSYSLLQERAFSIIHIISKLHTQHRGHGLFNKIISFVPSTHALQGHLFNPTVKCAQLTTTITHTHTHTHTPNP